MGGGSASGKGTLLKLLKSAGVVPGRDVLKINPDAIKEKLPEYQKIIAKGDSRAATVVHEESKEIAESIFGRAIDQRLNIILDRTMCNKETGLRTIKQAKAAGYEVSLYATTVDIQIAIERAVKRAQQTNRYVPIDALIATHRGFSEAFPAYAEIVDSAELWDTEGERSDPIAVVEDGKFDVLDHAAYDQFLSRKHLNIKAKQPDEVSVRP